MKNNNDLQYRSLNTLGFLKDSVGLKVCRSLLVLITLIGLGSVVHAAVDGGSQRMSQWIETKGALRGGESKSRVSIRDFRFIKSLKTKSERWVFEFGDREFKPLIGSPGYYQVELRNNPYQVVVNFNQTLNSKIDPVVLKNRMKGSRVLKDVRVEFDRSNQSMNFIFDLNSRVKIRTTTVHDPKKSGRLFVDLVPLSQLK